jgi:hypothetical protein
MKIATRGKCMGPEVLMDECIIPRNGADLSIKEERSGGRQLDGGPRC